MTVIQPSKQYQEHDDFPSPRPQRISESTPLRVRSGSSTMTQTVSTHTTSTSHSDGTSSAASAAAPSFSGDGHQLGGSGGGGQPPDKNNKLTTGQLDDAKGLKKVTPAAKAGPGMKPANSSRLPPPFVVKPEHLTGAPQSLPYGSELGGFSGRSKGFGGVTLFPVLLRRTATPGPMMMIR